MSRSFKRVFTVIRTIALAIDTANAVRHGATVADRVHLHRAQGEAAAAHA